jgi:hypothetical protein
VLQGIVELKKRGVFAAASTHQEAPLIAKMDSW